MLSVRSLSVAYGTKDILFDINLNLDRGEILGLIGPNGSGKTTLIKAVSGVLKNKEGAIKVDRRDLMGLSHEERAKLIAVVPQAAHLPPAFTVWEAVSLGRTPHLNWLGRMGARDVELVCSALQACEIHELKDRRISELSGGEQQRVLLARTLAQSCPILLLDEPTAHLDLHHQVALLNLVRKMAKEQHLAVLVAMHDLNLAALYADRLALLVDGAIRSTGIPAEVLQAGLLQNVYRVPLDVHPHPQNGIPWVTLLPERPG
ncbi:MAG: heme ABC transporter ATP-binding protein [Anaerolineales bacterium]